MPVQLTIREQDGIPRDNWPITGGIALAEGFAPEGRTLALRDEQGGIVESQVVVTRQWNDGSARWVLLDFQQSLDAHERKALSLDVETDAPASTNARVEPAGVVEGEPLPRIAGTRAIAGSRLHVVDDTGRAWTDYRAIETVVETSGPLRSEVRTAGKVVSPDGNRFVRWEARTHFFRDVPWTRTQLTYVVDGESPPLVLRELSVVADIAGEGQSRFRLSGALAWSPNVEPTLTDAPATIVQMDSAHSYIAADDGTKLVDQTVKNRGYVGVEPANAESGLAIALTDMWQSYPKALRASADSITVSLWPSEADEPFETSPGLARTHTLHVLPYESAEAVDSLACIAAPILPTLSIEQWNATGVLPPMLPRENSPIPVVEHLAWKMHTGYSLFTNERNIGVWGLGELNWGDFTAESYNNRGLDQTYGKGIVWGNGEAQVGYGMLLQHLRTGQIEYLQQGLACARHKADVDTIHEHADDWRVGGQHIHTAGHTLGKATWCHMWTSELALAYLLTGDTRLRDVTRLTGDYLAREASKAPLERFVMRTGGWLLIALCACYEALGDENYLVQGKRATEGIRQWIGKGATMFLPPRMRVHTPVHTFIALTGVADYWRLTGDPLAVDTLLEGGELALERGRDEGGFFFVADGQAYREAGRWPMCHSLIVLATLYEITGARKWLEVGMHQCSLMHRIMQADTGFGREENWAQGGIYLTWAHAFYQKAHDAGLLRDMV